MVINYRPLQSVYGFVECFQYVIQMFLVCPVGADVESDPDSVAAKGMIEYGGILCGEGILLPETGSRPD